MALTNYDLLTTLRYYDIRGIEDDDVIILQQVRDGYPMQVTARLEGYESRPRDFSSSTQDIERQLQQWVHREIAQADLDATLDVSTAMMHRFFDLIQITNAIVPVLVRCGEYEIEIETEGIPSITAERRDL